MPPPLCVCCLRPCFLQLNLDPQQVVLALPNHVLACLLGYLSGVLKSGPKWSAELTDCALTDTGPLDHVVRGASVLVTFLELIPRFRCACHARVCALLMSCFLHGRLLELHHLLPIAKAMVCLAQSWPAGALNLFSLRFLL